MSVEDRVKSIIVEQLGVDAEEVNPEASFVEDLGPAVQGSALSTFEETSWRNVASSSPESA